jgi:ABC-type polysaccharide/polyol phosphate export permease
LEKNSRKHPLGFISFLTGIFYLRKMLDPKIFSSVMILPTTSILNPYGLRFLILSRARAAKLGFILGLTLTSAGLV